jgi:hypothetical protein
MQSNEKKKGFDWMFAKPVDEVKDHWVRWAATISIYRSIVVAKSFEYTSVYYFFLSPFVALITLMLLHVCIWLLIHPLCDNTDFNHLINHFIESLLSVLLVV